MAVICASCLCVICIQAGQKALLFNELCVCVCVCVCVCAMILSSNDVTFGFYIHIGVVWPVTSLQRMRDTELGPNPMWFG